MDGSPRPPGVGAASVYQSTLPYSISSALASSSSRALDLTQPTSTRNVPTMLMGSNSLTNPFTPQFHMPPQVGASSLSPMHLVGAANPYMSQLSQIREAIDKNSCSPIGHSRLGYFPSVTHGLNPSLLPRGPQLTPSAFLSSTHQSAHSSSSGGGGSSSGGGGVSCPLPTPDAMGYLEQVKHEFGSNSSTYNEFLEIMKDFKDQTLSTIGVIKRIGALFLRFPNLINGFNTFLPPGYRLEAGNERKERILLYSPTCSVHTFSEEDLVKEQQSSGLRHVGPVSVYRRDMSGQTKEPPTPAPLPPPQQPPVTQQQPEPPGSSSAIAYVNKIKVRFDGAPEMYQEFLDILHSYQSEQLERSGNASTSDKCGTADARVFTRITKLFRNDKDLLDEFSQFLPDAPMMSMQSCRKSPPAAEGGAETEGSSSVGSSVAESTSQQSDADQQVVVCKQDTTAQGRRRKTAAAAAMDQLPPRKRTRLSAQTEKGRASTAGSRNAKTTVAAVPDVEVMEVDDDVDDEDEGDEEDMMDINGRPLPSLQTCLCVEKLRYAFKDERIFLAFLCTLKLFNLNYLSRAELANVLRVFLKDNDELSEWISSSASKTVPGLMSKKLPEMQVLDLNSCEQRGVSYRVIPENYLQPKSSGMSSLGKSVLNLKYLSFPTSHSEENPVLSLKRTLYEETVFNVEEERFEADIIMEVNRALMDSLRSITSASNLLPETVDVEVDETLNTGSLSVALRGLRRVYGRYAQQFYDAIRISPRTTAKLVWQALRQKHGEWVITIVSLNRNWRGALQRNYWKTLETQGAAYKLQDMKTIRTRALVNMLETAAKERQEVSQQSSIEEAKPHMTITFADDDSSFSDVGDLILHYVRRQNNINPSCKRRITCLVDVFLPSLLGLKTDTSNVGAEQTEQTTDKKTVRGNGNKVQSTTATATAASAGPSTALRGRNKRRRGTTRANAPCRGRKTLADQKTLDNGDLMPAEELKILAAPKTLQPMPNYTVLYLPNAWYVFLRLYHKLDERLNDFHRLSSEVTNRRGQSDSEYLFQTKTLQNRFIADARPPLDKFYNQLINLTKHLLDNVIDYGIFEDAVREVFTFNAFRAFSFFKIVQIMSRQLQLIVNDPLLVRAFCLYEKWFCRIIECISPVARQNTEALYEKEARAMLANVNCIKIIFRSTPAKTISFQLMETSPSDTEESSDLSESKEVTSSTLWDSMPPADGVQIFMRRNVVSACNSLIAEAVAAEAETITADQKCTTFDLNTLIQTMPGHCWKHTSFSHADQVAQDPIRVKVKKSYWNTNTAVGSGNTNGPPRVVGKQSVPFIEMIESWAEKNTTVSLNRQMNKLLLGDWEDPRMMATWMRRIEDPCPHRPPYFSVNHYVKHTVE